MATLREEDMTRRRAAEPVAEPVADPMSTVDKHVIEAAALRQAEDGRGEIMEARRKGRVEAETHRISEEVTHAAQKRERARMANTPVIELAEGTAALKVPQDSARPRHALPPVARLRSVVVPLDGTSDAERALPYAAGLAAAAGAHLTLAHVLGPHGRHPEAVLDRILAHVVIDAIPPEVNDDLPTYLESLRQRLALLAPDSKALLISASSVEKGLLALEERGEADALAIAPSRHHDGTVRYFGHVVAGVVRHGRAPVLLVPPQVPAPAEERPTMARVLVPLDGSQLAEASLPVVGALLRGGHVREVALLNAEETFLPHPEGEAYLGEVRRMLRDLAPASDAAITTAVVPGAAPATIVAVSNGQLTGRNDGRTIAARPFDLIVMATHARGGLGRWLVGSVADYVLAHVARPVLIVHPGDPATR